MDKRTLLLILLIATPVFPRRSSGGGGMSAGRGSSGARGNPSGGFAGNQGGGGGFQGGHPGGGFQPNNNFRPQPQPGFGGGGFQQPHPNVPAGGFGGGAGGFRPGGGPSSFQQQGIGSRASSGGWKTALAAGALGAVGGVVAWEAGKAIIGNAHTPFSHGGRDYYWDNNGQAQMKNGMQMCSMPLETLQAISAPPATTTTTTVAPSVTVDPNAPSTTAAPTPDAVLNTIQYSNGTRPKTVSWSCNARTEVCCGTECCPAPVQQSPPINQSSRPSSTGAGSIGTIVALIIIFLLLLCCCGCFIVYKCFGGICGFVSGDNKRDQYDQGQGEYPMQQYGQQQQYSQPQYDQHAQGSYPAQNQQYPAQGGYPPQPQYPNQYNPNQYPAYPQHPQY